MMPTSEAKRNWMKENTVMINARLTKNQDGDIIEYLKDKPIATTIKKSIREYMKNHPKEVNEAKPFWDELEEEEN